MAPTPFGDAATPDHSRRDARNATWITVSTAAVSAVLLVVVAYAGLMMNRSALAIEHALVDKELSRAVVERLNEQKSIAFWDQAAHHAATAPRAWLDEQVGGYMTGTFAHDAVYLISPDDRQVYRYFRTAPFVDGEVMRAAAPLVARIRHHRRGTGRDQNYRPFNGALQRLRGARLVRWAGDIVTIAGEPTIIAITTLTPPTDKGLASSRPALLMSVVRLTPAALARIGIAVDITGLRVTRDRPRAADRATMPLLGADGQAIGWLSWVPQHPGRALLTIALPLLLLGSGWVGFANLSLLHRIITASRRLRRQEAEARALALQDPVSGLPNRRAFNALLTERLERWRAGATPRPAVAYLDLDHFKDVNDTLGHAAGDALVVAVAERLRRALPPAVTLARIGGDEFAVIAGAPTEDAEHTLARLLCGSLEQPFMILGDRVSISASIGIAVAEGDDSSPDSMTRDADIALYDAKAKGRSRASVFAPAMAQALLHRRTIETDLRKAIAGGQLQLIYQPVLRLADGHRIGGVEALLRWRHPTLGHVSPDEFIPIAEASQQMSALGDWVINRAFADMALRPQLEISINLSPTQLRRADFAERVAAAAQAAGIDPRRVLLEVTEHVILDATARTRLSIDSLRRHGFRIALDDFGTGYSSLSYLAQYHFDRLKIDRSLIEGVGDDPAATAVMETSIALGRRLGLEVVAEGIETERQATLMRVAGCTHLQGYLIARPLALSQLDALLDKRTAVCG